MKKPHIAVIAAIFLVMYFGLMSVVNIFNLRRPSTLSILDPNFHSGDLMLVEEKGQETGDFRHPYFKALRRVVMLDHHSVGDAVDVLVAMLRNWRSLNKEEQVFCRKTLNRVVRGLSRRQFDQILDAWRASCEDVAFFLDALKKKPEFYKQLAGRLVRSNEELKMRTGLMANFEIYWMDRVNQITRQLAGPTSTYREWRNLGCLLKRGVRGYYRLTEEHGLLDQRYSLLLKRIYLNTLDCLLRLDDWEDSPILSKAVEDTISTYLDDFSAPNEVGALGKFLQRADFFENESLWVFSIRERLQFAAGHYPQVIRNCEELLGSREACPPEEVRECIDLMLLLSDAHIASHLLSSAIPVLSDAERMEPGRMDVGWRMFQVHRIIGVGDQLASIMKQRFQTIENSQILEIYSPVQKKSVFVLDRQELELRLASGLLARMTNPRLIQVVMDGCVVSEIALSELDRQSTLSLPLNCPRFSRHDVVVTVM